MPGDALDLFNLIDSNRPDLKKFWWESSTHTVNDSRDFIDIARAAEAAGSTISRGVHTPDRLIGIGSIHHIDRGLSRAALGYWLDASESGNGYATEVARKLVDVAFSNLGLSKLVINACADNEGSRRVAEKAGFELVNIDDVVPWNKPMSGVTAQVAHYQLSRD